MYGATELAKMLNTTRRTIYNKLSEECIQEYVVDTDKGKRLTQDGFKVLCTLMADSKVDTNDTSKISDTVTPKNDEFLQKYIQRLEDENKRLLDENNDVKQRYDGLFKMILETQTKLLESSEQKEKRSVWERIFKS